jgi:Ca-activated chloride channel family protein
MRSAIRVGILGLALAVAVAGCSSLTGSTPSTVDDGTLTDGPTTLRIIAGSEVKDLVPLLTEAESAIGVKVELNYSGTLDGTQLVASGGADGVYDATWFPNNRYLSLLPGAASAIRSSVKIMSSPVVLGVRASVAERLGWTTTAPTWADIASAAAAGKFTYGMTNPAASNSGFSALVAVATALSGTGSALTDSDINSVTPQLTSFFSAQKLTAGSSGWLADKFVADPSAVDGIINYESVLKELTVDGEKLTVITPTDGVVTSDYPLTLLTSADASKKALFDKLTAWLTSTAIQQRIVTDTHRRPGVPGIDTGTEFPSTILFETPFPNTLDVANTLIGTYLNTVRAPAQTIFVLDTSGSMEGDRLSSLQEALKNLAGADTSTSGGFAAFHNREHVTLLPFNDSVGDATSVDVPQGDTSAALQKIRDVADGLQAGGGTAIYDALEHAYGLALQQKQQRPDTFVSIVLMTDGENRNGSTVDDFTSFYKKLGTNASTIPTFVVLFGDANVQELTGVATLTGGKVFDALNGDLASAFRDIRGYQ